MTAETVRQIIRWIDKCSQEHIICQQYRQLGGSEKGLPLRLINVDPNGEYLGDELRKTDIDLLSCEKAPHSCIKHSREAASMSPNGVQYLTLSHRWGDTAPTKLTWENMAQFSEQIPVSSLSAPFKDAIQITRCLGFRYLWIDSICINQDDSAEKASEIGRMENIYRYSQLNLSATSGETGLIFPRNPRSVLPILKRMNTTQTSAFKDEADATGEYLMISAGPWETFVDLGPLNHRAWVVQERLLAPRVLHCCHNMVYWECACLRASEVDPLGEVDHDIVTNSVDLRTNIKNDFVMASMNRYTVEGHTKSIMELLHPFHLIVRSYYFPMELTYPRDRLPAISGIARWCMSRLGLSPESYVAGLWQETLPWCLLWHFFKPPEGGAVRDLEAAPSWSWASIISNNHIILGNWDMVDGRPLFQDLQPIIISKNGDRFAQLEVATLRLQATVIPVEREWRNGSTYMRLFRDKKWYKESLDPWSAKETTLGEKLRRTLPLLGRRLGIISKQKLAESFERATTRSYIQVRWDTTDMLWSDEMSFRPRQLYLIPVVWYWGKGSLVLVEPGKLIIRGLILQRLPSKGQYGRVGMFMTANYSRYPNPELSQNILRHMPRQALLKISDGALQRSYDGRQPISHLVAKSFQQKKWSGESRDDALGSQDHLGVNEDGLHMIEIW